MCRLFALKAQEATPVVVPFEQLKEQSREHKDGWGLVTFDDSEQRLWKSLKPAHGCDEYARLQAALTSRHLVLHLRLASVGGVHERNTHPFQGAGWTFMHNGTAKDFAQNKDRVEALIAPRLRASLQGDTDSERCFAIFQTHLETMRSTSDALAVPRALARTVQSIIDVCDDGSPGEKSALNFLCTDGRSIWASRRGRSLHLHQSDRAVMISSDPLKGLGEWTSLEEQSVVQVDANRAVTTWSLSGLL